MALVAEIDSAMGRQKMVVDIRLRGRAFWMLDFRFWILDWGKDVRRGCMILARRVEGEGSDVMRIAHPKSKIQNLKSAFSLSAGLPARARARLLGPEAAERAAGELPLDRIKLPPGFSIGVFSDGCRRALDGAVAQGHRLRGDAGEGKVYAVVDSNQDGRADEVFTIASGLNTPNGVAWQRRRPLRGRDLPRAALRRHRRPAWRTRRSRWW